ncbi:MAG: hypothetical protein KJ667_05030 [Alphaproteobacteria bacterium]|nr:hypothetical protein [Alphaproteobacteria bacterium]
MTETTRAQMPQSVAEGMQSAAPPGQVVIVLGPDDYDEAGSPTRSLTDQFNAAGIDPTQGMGQVLSSILSMHAGWGAVSASSERVNSPPVLETIRAMHGDHIHEMPADTCMVVVPMEPNPTYGIDLRTPQGFAEGLLMSEQGVFDGERIPGTAAEMQLFIAHHEMAHCENSDEAFPEYKSDAWANAQYARDLGAGRAVDAELPYFARAQRASATMMGMDGETYRTNALSPLAGETPLSDEQLTVAEGQINQAVDRLYNRIEQNTGMTKEQFVEPENSRLQAQLVYEESRTMIAQGALDDVPYGKVVAERFVDGAERYGHGLYNVDPTHQNIQPPELSAAARGMSLPNFAVSPDQSSQMRFGAAVAP